MIKYFDAPWRDKFLNIFLLFFIFAVSPVFAQNNLNLDQALRSLGETGEVQLRWDPFFASGTFTVGQHQAAFVSGNEGESGLVLLNYQDTLTLPLPFMEGGTLKFPETFIDQVKLSFNRLIEEDNSRYRVAVIVVDPGHGGRDPGTVWTYTVNGTQQTIMEKDIVLKVSQMLHSSLRTAFPDKRVLLTRTGDTNPSLDERVSMANSVPLADNEAAVYISVHANSSFNRTAQGFEVFYLSPSHRRNMIDRSLYADTQEIIPILNSMLEERVTTESIHLANSILRGMNDAIGDISPNRGIKAHDWFVVRNAMMPSVLVELGFLSNREEALRMTGDAYLKKLSDALYKGISDFVTFFERSGGFTALQ